MTYNFKPNCVIPMNGKNKTLKTPKEARKCFICSNNFKDILIINLDDCLAINQVKCDFLVIPIIEHNAHYIEIKGKDIKKAVEQIIETDKYMSNLSNNYIQKKFNKKYGYIIPSAVPAGTSTQNIIKTLGKNGIIYGGMKNTQMEINL